MKPVAGRIRNTDLVRESDPRQQRLLLLLLALVLGLALPMLFYVWQHNRSVSLTYRIQDLREELDESRERGRLLDARLEALSSPAEVKRRVEGLDLDLEAPEISSIRVVRPAEEAAGEERIASTQGGETR
jgi:hypothetical protein